MYEGGDEAFVTESEETCELTVDRGELMHHAVGGLHRRVIQPQLQLTRVHTTTSTSRYISQHHARSTVDTIFY